MVSPYIKAELTAAVSSLGYTDGGIYYKDQYCLEALKDVIRYLRRDNDNLDIRRELGQMKIIQTSLIPILCEYNQDEDLFQVTLRLLVNLTNPTLLLFNEQLPQEKVMRNYFMQHVGHLQGYKAVFSMEKFWIVLTDKLKLLLNKDTDERLEDEKLTVERILILVRNILDIPPNPEEEKKTDDDASIHDQVLWSMHLSGMEDVIIYLASNENERHFCMHVMEIISLMLREQDPATLARAAAQRSTAEQRKDSDELASILRRENAEKEAKMKKMVSSRSSIFRGTFCVKDVKSISERELIVHHQVADPKQLDFSREKTAKRKAKNRLAPADSTTTRRSTLAIRLMLKELCLQLLNGAYNSLMHTVKDCLVRHKAQDHDETYYLWAVKFFMEFNRNSKFRVELVSETMSVQLFHYIQGLIENYSEMLRMEKGKGKVLWSRRLHLAVRAYQELLMTLAAMDKYSTESVKKSARVIKSNVFYVLEYREMCLVLLQNFNETQHSLGYLKDLVETTHIFLKLFEQFCQSNRHVVVQKKARSGPSKSRVKKKNQKRDFKSEDCPTVTFDEISGEISDALHREGATEPTIDVAPFDPASDVPIDDQKTGAMAKIQNLLRESKIGDAIALLRASRDVWPEGDVFGAAEVQPDEELLILREIFHADLSSVECDDKKGGDPHPLTEDDADQDDEESEGKNIEEEEMAQVKISEQELTFEDFVRRFAHFKIAHAYSLLMGHYATNSTLTNHCLAKMLHRIAWDCKMPAMLFQASLFRAFQKILDDPKSKVDPSIKELAKFGTYIVRKFADVSTENRKVFAELLFWKTARDATEIEMGYGNYKEPTKGSASLWSEEEEDELERLYHEFKDVDDPERSLVDRIMSSLINQNRSRRLVIKKLKDLGLASSTKDVSRPRKTLAGARPPKDWADHEVAELRRLFEEVRGSSDPLGLLIDRLPIRRAKPRIKAKILELGLVDDAKELRKKRPAKSGKPRRSAGSHSNEREREEAAASTDEDDDGDDGEEEEEEEDSDDGDDDGGYRRSKQRKQDALLRLNAAPFNGQVATGLSSQLIENGCKAGLQWVLDCLREAHQDRLVDDEVESIPLLPLSAESTAAMDNHQFLNLIRMMGFTPPANEQEQYWRIPSTLPTPVLLKRIHFLETALAGGEEEATPSVAPVSASADAAVGAAGGKRSSSDSVEEEPAVHKRRRIIQDDSSDDDDDGADEVPAEAAPASASEAEAPPASASAGGRNKRLLVFDDSDSE